jgi:hypothetical protein
MTSSIMKKTFGHHHGRVNTSQASGASQGCDPGTGNSKTSTTVQEGADSQDQQPESSTDIPLHPVYTRSTRNSSSASTDVQVDSTIQVPDELPEEPLLSSNNTPVVAEPTAPESQTPGNDAQQGELQPAAEMPPISAPDTTEATQENHSTASPENPQALLAPPIPPPVRDGRARRTSSPRNVGLKSFTVQIEPKYHARVKKAARDHDVTVKRMVVMMIENCFPTP